MILRSQMLLVSILLLIGESAAETAIVEQECRRIAGKLASVAFTECMDRNLQLTDGISVKDAPILIKEYPPLLDQRQPVGRVLLIGGIHGDEYSSVSVIFKWMRTLDSYHSGLFHWRIAPLVNPDGLLQDDSHRNNANGVDLNRNFPTRNWEDEAQVYWINKTGRNPRRYPGPGPLSEPESRWLVREINTFKPDVIVSVHAPHGIVDYDGPQDGPYKLGRLYLNLLGTYPGSLGRYAGVQEQIPVVTIELPYAGIMPTPAEINNIWLDLVKWLSQNLPVSTMADENRYDMDPS